MKKLVWLLAAILSFSAINLRAEEIVEYKIQIKNHLFIPDNLTVESGKKIKLVIENLDKTIEEFESQDFNREKIIGGGKTITIIIGPLKPGSYKFFGDFHQRTAQGVINVK